jgi:uncharacterized protein (DUF4415 family)
VHTLSAVEFEWDELKAAANLRKHGVDFADAALVLEDDLALTMRDPVGRGEERWVTMGAGSVSAGVGRRLHLARGAHSPDLGLKGNRRRAAPLRDRAMRKEYDFGQAKRGSVVPVPKGKTRITIRLDEDVVEWFKQQVHAAGGGNYQSLINAALRKYIEERREPLEETLRRVIREELKTA